MKLMKNQNLILLILLKNQRKREEGKNLNQNQNLNLLLKIIEKRSLKEIRKDFHKLVDELFNKLEALSGVKKDKKNVNKIFIINNFN